MPLTGAILSLIVAAGPVPSGGAIHGTVSWVRTSSPAFATVLRDRHVCGASGPIYEQQVEVDAAGRVAGVIVYVADAPKETSLPKQIVKIDQRNCLYVPIAVAATIGSTLEIKSSDPVLHNVHATDGGGRTVANWALPIMGEQVRVELTTSGLLSLRCDAGHDWMRASVLVLEHRRFALTDKDGSFAIGEVAPGSHRVIAWHPEIGRIERTVIVPEKASVDVTIVFKDDPPLAQGE